MKFVAAIPEELYFYYAINGSRRLFENGELALLDGIRHSEDDELEDKQSYFIKNEYTDVWYMIDLATAYDLITCHRAGNRDFLFETMNELIDVVHIS